MSESRVRTKLFTEVEAVSFPVTCNSVINVTHRNENSRGCKVFDEETIITDCPFLHIVIQKSYLNILFGIDL